MKKTLLLLATAFMLPLGSAWAGGTTTYYAALKAKVSGNSSAMGKVYAGTSTTAGTYSETESTSANQTSTTKDEAKTFYAHAKANDGFEFSHWSSAENSDTVASKDNPYKVTVKASSSTEGSPTTTTVWANFKKVVLASFSVTFLTPANGSYTVDNATFYGTKSGLTEAYSPKLKATAAAGYAFNGWYTTTDGGTTKNYFAATEECTAGPYIADTTVGADFVESHAVKTAQELIDGVSAYACLEIPSGTEITLDSALTLPANKTLIVNGKLYLSATFTNSGKIIGGGTVIKLSKKITQTGNSDGSPITTDCADANKNKTYYKSAIANMSGAVSGTAPICSVHNGARIVRNNIVIGQCSWPTSVTPVALCCTIASTTAVNHITGFDTTSYYTSFADALKAVKGNTTTKMLLLLSNQSADQATCVNAGLTYTTTDGKYTKLQGNLGVIDLLGYQLTVKPSYIDTYTHILLNGKLSVTTLMYSGTVTCLNCSAVTFSTMKEDYSSVINIYDCTCSAQIVSGYNGSNEMKSRINFYSSSAGTSYSSSKFYKTKTAYRIFGGRWDENPGETYIGDTLKQTHKFYQNESDSKWYLEPSADKKVVTLDDGTTYESLAEAFTAIKTAFDAGTKTSVVMTMEKNATLATPFTVPAGKTLEIELAGFKITASTGLIVNNGTFIIGDKDGNLASTGGSVVTTSGNFIVNNGEVHITYGYYTGNMVLNGGTFTTHHGAFTGSVSGTKAYADLKGGYFTQSVTAFLQDGYYQRSYYVGPLPTPVVTKSYVSGNGGYWKYNIKLLSDKDSTIYCNDAVSKSGYSVDDWRRRGEIQSMVTPYFGYTIDTAIRFDRAIASGSATANVTKPSIVGANNLNKDVAAGGLYRILSEQLAHPTSSLLSPSSQIGYQTALKDSTYKEMEFGVYSAKDDNQGTTMDMRFDLCTGANGTDITYLRSVYALMAESTVIGAQATSTTKKLAMIQPTTGAATFYDTIAAAVNACAQDGTVKLCNDIDSTADIVIAKSCKIDTNGMNVKGTIKAGDGYAMTVTDTTPSIESGLGKNCKVYTFAPITYTITYNLDGGTNHADNPETYTVESETITLKDPTKADYSFSGWTPEGTIEKGTTGDKTFTATWELALVTITIPDVEHTTKTIVCSEGEATLVEGDQYMVKPGVTVTVTYAANYGYAPKTTVRTLEDAQAGGAIDVKDIVIEDIAVARIVVGVTTNRYETLAEAFKAVKADETIEVLADLALDEPIVIGDNTPAYTLDFGGHAIVGALNLGSGKVIDVANVAQGSLITVTTAAIPAEKAPVAVTKLECDPIFFASWDSAYWATTNDVGQVALATVSNPVVEDIDGNMVTIDVSEDFRKKYEPTGEEIMRPDQPMQNGMSAWQNDVLGLDPTDGLSGVYADTPQNTDAANVTVEIRNLDKVSAKSGYEIVGYRLEKQGGEVKSSDTPSFNIDITEEDSTGLYQLSTIVRKDGQNDFVAETINVVGLVKQVQAVTNALISVPWGQLSSNFLENGEIAVSNVVKTANLHEGDRLNVYDPTTRSYRTWTLNKDKQWQSGTTLKLSAKGKAPLMTKAAEPEVATIKRGSGIWLCRDLEHVNEPYYLYGQYDGDDSDTAIVKGANLVGATGADDYDLNEHITGAQLGDKIVVPGEKDVPIIFEFKDGAWGHMKSVATTIIFKGQEYTTFRNEWTTDDAKVKPGTGFWLYNNSGKVEVK